MTINLQEIRQKTAEELTKIEQDIAQVQNMLNQMLQKRERMIGAIQAYDGLLGTEGEPVPQQNE